MRLAGECHFSTRFRRNKKGYTYWFHSLIRLYSAKKYLQWRGHIPIGRWDMKAQKNPTTFIDIPVGIFWSNNIWVKIHNTKLGSWGKKASLQVWRDSSANMVCLANYQSKKVWKTISRPIFCRSLVFFQPG
jgi:hypothetical protein